MGKIILYHVKQKPQGSLLERKLKNKKNGAKFGKVNFNG